MRALFFALFKPIALFKISFPLTPGTISLPPQNILFLDRQLGLTITSQKRIFNIVNWIGRMQKYFVTFRCNSIEKNRNALNDLQGTRMFSYRKTVARE
ncbi:MAG: hypothetical protein Q7K26_02515 [bacterium]|nr:hypothetical protein [bacterium]